MSPVAAMTRSDPEVSGARHVDLVAQACRAIEAAETPPALGELARRAGMSRFHFQRVFKSVVGVTPRVFAEAVRARRVREALPRAASVTDAFYEAGFNSSGRFYEAADGLLGMTPSAFRAGGPGVTIRFAFGASSLGAVLVAATEKGVCALFLGKDPAYLKRELARQFRRATLVRGDAAFEQLVARVVTLIEEPRRGLDLPLDLRGTAFQQRVWRALRKIPAGRTVTYSELAERIGAPRAVRAVASACANNPVSVIVPCHRVLRRDGDLAGYRWGVARKRALLDREANQTEKRKTGASSVKAKNGQ